MINYQKYNNLILVNCFLNCKNLYFSATIITLKDTFEKLRSYNEEPAMNETLELPKTIDEAIKLLKEAGVHMDGKGRDAVTSQTSQTVHNVISLVDSFVNYTIDFMKEVRVHWFGQDLLVVFVVFFRLVTIFESDLSLFNLALQKFLSQS